MAAVVRGDSIDLDVGALRRRPAMPSRCARHGEVAGVRTSVIVVRRPPRPRFVDAGAGMVSIVNRLSRVATETTMTKLDEWPMCGRCLRRRSRFRAMTWVLFLGGALGFFGGLITGFVLAAMFGTSSASWLLAPVLIGLGMMLVSPFTLTKAQPADVAKLSMPEDGMVRVTSPHTAFNVP